jgi:sugar lactone lactonase YvrE
VDAAGTLYFVDTHWQRIYKWDAQNREGATVSSDPLQPENLGLDTARNLLVVSRSGAGKVYVLRPDGPAGEIETIQ